MYLVVYFEKRMGDIWEGGSGSRGGLRLLQHSNLIMYLDLVLDEHILCTR